VVPTEDGITRRGVLLGTAGLIASTVGCSSTGTPGAASTPFVLVTPSALTSSSQPAALPALRRWQTSSNDVEPAAKLAAVRVVEALGTYSHGDALSAARQRLRALGQNPALAAAGQALLHPGPAAVIQVIDAQYGGILASTASVLVVCRQLVERADGSQLHSGTTVDVRLSKVGARWRVTELHPARAGPAAPTLTRSARKVLVHPQIALPPASAADVRSGQVHESVLRTMLALASDYRIGISVIRSGHPIHVFGTNRLSDHPRGRAFDTWSLNGHPVVDSRTPERLVVGYMERAAALGSYNVGGPYRLGGAQFFSDNTHHDHVHAGFAV
jgi:hypothetical protein